MPPHSMTAFARQSLQHQWGSATWEIRSVNHRFLETNFRLPEIARELEMPLRDMLRKTLNRGKLDISLQLKLSETTEKVEIDQPLTQQYIAAANQIAELLPQSTPLSPMEILRWPGILKEADIDMEQVKKELLTLFEQTLEQLIIGRGREGEKLAEIINDKLTSLTVEVEKVRELLPQLLTAQRDKIVNRLNEVTDNLDNDRLEQELTYIAQKADVAEEIDRLDTHIAEITHTLTLSDPMGRRLDFLLQELNREANTLASKSLAIETTQSAVELKVLIEQIREQIQNLE